MSKRRHIHPLRATRIEVEPVWSKLAAGVLKWGGLIVLGAIVTFMVGLMFISMMGGDGTLSGGSH